MTNEEKIKEIVIDAFEGWSKVGFTVEEMIAILSKLAEQFKEYLEKKKERELEKKNKYSTSISEENYYGYRATLIAEIINELFGGKTNETK